MNNILVVRLRESRNKSACMLLYSCTTLLHYCTRTPTTPRTALSTAHKILVPILPMHWNRSAFESVLKSHDYFQTSILIGLPVFWTCWLSTTKKSFEKDQTVFHVGSTWQSGDETSSAPVGSDFDNEWGRPRRVGNACAAYKILNEMLITILEATVAYRNAALKSQEWGLLTLAQLYIPVHCLLPLVVGTVSRWSRKNNNAGSYCHSIQTRSEEQPGHDRSNNEQPGPNRSNRGWAVVHNSAWICTTTRSRRAYGRLYCYAVLLCRLCTAGYTARTRQTVRWMSHQIQSNNRGDRDRATTLWTR